jgi:N-methylhydantoinase A
LRHDLVETHFLPLSPDSADRAAAIAARLSEAADRLLAADGVLPDSRLLEVRAEARYAGQSYELSIAYDHRSPGGWMRLIGDFHAAHRQRFGHADDNAPIEVVGFGATAIGKVDTPELPALSAGGPSPPAGAVTAVRDVYFEDDTLGAAGAWTTARVFRRDSLLAGNLIEGPAVIEEVSATTVLYPGDRARMHQSGALLVECGP